jgi:hypothetical protein
LYAVFSTTGRQPLECSVQKLVTIFLDPSGYDRKGGIRLSNADLHGRVQEHLNEYLASGWRIVHLACLAGSDAGGWIVAAIENEESAD